MKKYVLIFMFGLATFLYAEKTIKPIKPFTFDIGAGYTNYIGLAGTKKDVIPQELLDKIPGTTFGLKRVIKNTFMTGISFQNDDFFIAVNLSGLANSLKTLNFKKDGAFLVDLIGARNYTIPIGKTMKFYLGGGFGLSIYSNVTNISATVNGKNENTRIASLKINTGISALLAFEVFFTKHIGLKIQCTDILTLASIGQINHTDYKGNSLYSLDSPFTDNFHNIVSAKIGVAFKI